MKYNNCLKGLLYLAVIGGKKEIINESHFLN